MINPAQFQKVLGQASDDQLMTMLRRPDKIPSQFIVAEINRRQAMRQASKAQQAGLAQQMAQQPPSQMQQMPRQEPRMEPRGMNQGGIPLPMRKPSVGQRNRNPMNLRPISGDPFFGTVGVSPQNYTQFESDLAGLRAGFVNMDTQKKKGVDTIRDYIGAYAPVGENAPLSVSNYMQFVADNVGVGVDDKIDLSDPDTQLKVADAQIKFENNADDDYYKSIFPLLKQAQTLSDDKTVNPFMPNRRQVSTVSPTGNNAGAATARPVIFDTIDNLAAQGDLNARRSLEAMVTDPDFGTTTIKNYARQKLGQMMSGNNQSSTAPEGPISAEEAVSRYGIKGNTALGYRIPESIGPEATTDDYRNRSDLINNRGSGADANEGFERTLGQKISDAIPNELKGPKTGGRDQSFLGMVRGIGKVIGGRLGDDITDFVDNRRFQASVDAADRDEQEQQAASLGIRGPIQGPPRPDLMSDDPAKIGESGGIAPSTAAANDSASQNQTTSAANAATANKVLEIFSQKGPTTQAAEVANAVGPPVAKSLQNLAANAQNNALGGMAVDGAFDITTLQGDFNKLSEANRNLVNAYNEGAAELLEKRTELMNQLDGQRRTPQNMMFKALIDFGLELAASPETNFLRAVAQAGKKGIATFDNLTKQDQQKLFQKYKMAYDIAAAEFDHNIKGKKLAVDAGVQAVSIANTLSQISYRSQMGQAAITKANKPTANTSGSANARALFNAYIKVLDDPLAAIDSGQIPEGYIIRNNDNDAIGVDRNRFITDAAARFGIALEDLVTELPPLPASN